MIKNLEIEECVQLLGNQYIGRLAFIAGKSPYIVPITFFYDRDEKCILSYSAKGHKIDSMRNYDIVSLQVDDIDSIKEWRSVIVHGKFEELKGPTAKKYLHKFAEGIKDIASRKGTDSFNFINDFSARLTHRGVPIVYKMNITDMVGKFRNE